MTRHRVATLGRPGPAWPRAVARWGSSATLPVEATTCVSAEELLALVSSTPIGFAIVEAGLPGVDRSLAAQVRRAGAALAVVEGPALRTAAERLEADVILAPDFDADDLSAALRAHARTRARATAPLNGHELGGGEAGELVAVLGAGGTGTSTIAQALATALASRGPTLLADLALDADQHLRHGVTPGHDGVFELADALRHAPPADVRAPTSPQAPGYDLVCGLRRRQEWVALSACVAEQLVEVLRRGHTHVVADLSAELDGRAETGSLDVEERNALARSVVDQAALVVVVGRGTTTGIPRLVRLLAEVERHGVDRRRLRPVVNGVPLRSGRRHPAARATRALLEDLLGDQCPAPVTVPQDRRVEACLREARPLPSRLVSRAATLLDAP
jgi:MinD-like ATPase involved in chromosome partitioning or flagellar assembly